MLERNNERLNAIYLTAVIGMQSILILKEFSVVHWQGCFPGHVNASRKENEFLNLDSDLGPSCYQSSANPGGITPGFSPSHLNCLFLFSAKCLQHI